MRPLVFPLDVRWTTATLIWLAFAATFVLPCVLLVKGVIEEPGGLILLFGLWFVILGFVFPQSYVLRHDALVIKQGLKRNVIPYENLASVENHDKGEVAASLYTLQVNTHDGGMFFIGPRDEDGFLAALAKRAPHCRMSCTYVDYGDDDELDIA